MLLLLLLKLEPLDLSKNALETTRRLRRLQLPPGELARSGPLSQQLPQRFSWRKPIFLGWLLWVWIVVKKVPA